MTDSEDNNESILAYQSQVGNIKLIKKDNFINFQLKYVEDAILRQEEEEGLASVELRQLRSDLREALSLFNESNSNNGIIVFLCFIINILYFQMSQ